MNPQVSEPPKRKPSWFAEASLVSSLIVDAKGRGSALSTVKAEMLEDERHKRIFGSILRLHLAGKPISTTSVGLDLNKRGEKAEAGGDGYLRELMQEAGDVKDGSHYAEEVKDAAQRRKILETCSEIEAVLLSGQDQRGEVRISDIVAKLLGVVAFQDEASSPVLIGDLISDALQPPSKSEGAPKCGIGRIDQSFNLFTPGELTILAGRPGSGKSSFMRQVAVNAADSGDVLIYSLEVTSRALCAQMLCETLGVEYSRWSNGFASQEEQERLVLDSEELGKKPIWISPCVNVGALDVRLQVKQLMADGHKPRLVVIDYLGLMRHEKAERKDLEIAGTTRALKQIALECEVPILLLCQLNREVEKGGTAEEHTQPRLFHLRDSGAIEQDADNVCFLWKRNKNEEFRRSEERIFTVEKRRNGQPGKVDLIFHKDKGRFQEMTTLDKRMLEGGAA